MSTIRCPSCGNIIDTSLDCCPYCGAQLDNKNEDLLESYFDDSYKHNSNDEWVERRLHEKIWSNYIISFSIIAVYIAALIFVICYLVYTVKNPSSGNSIQLCIFLLVFYIFIASVGIPLALNHFLKKKFIVKKVHGYTVLAYRFGIHCFLVCDDNELDHRIICDERRYHTTTIILKGNLPDKTKVWVEVRPMILHVGEEASFKN